MNTHGRHIKVLGRGTPSKLGDAKAVEKMLVDLIDILGMRMLDKAHIYDVEVEIEKLGKMPFEDEGGVTGICVLSTSHCSIHTWPVRPFFVVPDANGRATDKRFEGSVKGNGAVTNITPRLRQILSK